MSKDYFAYDAISYSAMKKLLESPAHYQVWKESLKTELPSDALRFGTAFDRMIFEPGFEPKVWTQTKTLNSRAADEYRFEHPDDVLVTLEEMDALLGMKRSLYSSMAKRFIENSVHQREIYGVEDTDHGQIPAKCMMDGIGDKFIFDLKSTVKSAKDFKWTAKQFRYDMQAAWYRHRALLADDMMRDVYFVVVEKLPPYGVMVWKADQETLLKGYDDCMRACEIFAKCRATNEWPCYDTNLIETF